MAKTIYFIRHAKSSWKEIGAEDIDRPLNKRGLRDAPFMANFLKDRESPEVGAIVSSPANRALSTANFFVDVFQLEPIIEPGIYEADESDLLGIINLFDPDWHTVLLFGHNPTFTYLVNHFTDHYIDNVPTCGMVKVVFESDDWNAIDNGNGKVMAFYYPKQFFNDKTL